MKFSGIDIPEKLLAAQENGTLVVFVGAGISIPSGFSNYNELADNIGKEFGFSRILSEPSDQYLGRVDENHDRAKKRAHEIFSDRNKTPCELHHFVIDLFKRGNPIRIVTTNYDPLLTTALNEKKISHETYFSPAMPLGSGFDGLVYLHGSTQKEHSRFILTDADFGHAYITHGWASTFLRDMFETYDVLFIGYSHSDPVMQYFARGLYKQNSKERYIITDDPGANWKLLKLTPIPFANADKSYKEQSSLLNSWAQFTQSPMYDQQERLKQILQNDPSQSLLGVDDEDFLKHILGNKEKFIWFLRHDSLTWLNWLQKNKYLDNLFNRRCVLNQIEQGLSSWLAETSFKTKEIRPLFELIADYKHALNPTLIFDLLMAIHRHGIQHLTPEEMNGLISILIDNSIVGDESDFWQYLLNQFVLPKDLNACLLVFEKLTSPRLGIDDFARRLTKDSTNLTFNVSYKNASYWLNDFWSKNRATILATTCADDFYFTLRSAVETSYRLLHPQKVEKLVYDRLSGKRPAVERHHQNHDYGNDAFDFILSGLADIVEWYAKNCRTRTEEEIRSLSSSPHTLLKRVSFHLVTTTTFLEPSAKLNWALGSGHLFEYHFHHESFSLLKAIYPLLSPEDRKRLLEYAISAHLPDEKEPNREEYSKWMVNSRLAWLKESDPKCSIVLDYEKRSSPEGLKTRDHADFTSWVGEAQWIPDKSPITADQILSGDVSNVIDELLKVGEKSFDGPSQWGSQKEVEKAISLKPEFSFHLAASLKERDLWSNYLWKGIFDGWEKTLKTAGDWEMALDIIDHHPKLSEFATDLTRNLLKCVESESIPDSSIQRFTKTLQNIYELGRQSEGDRDEPDDWLQRAINDFSGNVVFAWLHLLSGRKAKELPSDAESFFDKIILGTTVTDKTAKCALASQAHYLYFLSPTWTTRSLLPLFSTEHQDWRPAWHGYLKWGRLSRDLVLKMLPSYSQLFSAQGTDDIEDRATEFLSFISLSGIVNPFDADLIVTFLLNRGSDGAEKLASHLSRQIEGMKPEDKDGMWTSWLSRYVGLRFSNTHTTMSEKEYGWLLSLCFKLGGQIGSSVKMIVENAALPLKDGWVFHEIRSSNVHKTHPSDVIAMLIHVLPRQQTLFYRDDIEVIVEEITALDMQELKEDLLKICGELVRMGSTRISSTISKLRVNLVS